MNEVYLVLEGDMIGWSRMDGLWWDNRTGWGWPLDTMYGDDGEYGYFVAMF